MRSAEVSQCTCLQELIPVAFYICQRRLGDKGEMNNKNEEVAALEALRDSSAELVKYLDAMNGKLTQLNQQNELSLRVLENWSSVIAITKATSSSDKNSGGPNEIMRKAL